MISCVKAQSGIVVHTLELKKYVVFTYFMCRDIHQKWLKNNCQPNYWIKGVSGCVCVCVRARACVC